MKAVLISIQPKWVEKIASGNKTIEVRKTKPKLERPFKCYIYCTNWKDNTYWKNRYKDKLGKVVGEFVCRGMMDGGSHLLPKQSCLTIDEIFDYAKGKRVYGWRIADLKIYDKPKELGEFKTCNKCKYGKIENKTCFDCDGYKIARPPQSWCYVEEKE